MSKILEQLRAVDEKAQASTNIKPLPTATKKPQRKTNLVPILGVLICLSAAYFAFSYHQRRLRNLKALEVSVPPLEKQLELLFAEGSRAFEAKNYTLAEESFQKLNQALPEIPEPLVNMALAQKEKGDLSQSEETLQKALKVDPNHPVALNNLGLLYLEKGSFSKALECFEKAIKIKPKYLEALINIAYLHETQKEWAKALGYYEVYLTTSGDSRLNPQTVRERVRRLHSLRVFTERKT